MNRVVHFEIQADNPERAMRFYRDAFGWNFQQWGDQKYWFIMTAEQGSKEPGINGGLLPRPAKMPPKECGTNAYACTVQVENFDETSRKIEEAGGLVAMPKFAIPGMAWQGYFLDPEGNVFGVHQPDKNAH
jgi:uncharacterized protein